MITNTITTKLGCRDVCGGISDIFIEGLEFEFPIESCKYTIEDGKASIQIILLRNRFINYNFDNLKANYILAQNVDKTEFLLIKNPTINYRYVSGKSLDDLNGCYIKFSSTEFNIDKCYDKDIRVINNSLWREKQINSILED
jgi:hypothetical protein